MSAAPHQSPGVCIVAERVPPAPGGLAVAVERVARQAAARGERVHVVHLSSGVEPGARGRRTAAGVVLHPVGRSREEEVSWMAVSDHVVDVVRREGLSLVHGFYAIRPGHAAVVAAAAAGVPALVSLRGNDLDRGLFRTDHLPLLDLALRRADHVTAVSRALQGTASTLFARPVTHITNSVDVEAFRPEARDGSIAAALGLGRDPVLGFSGELRHKKGLRFLLPAFARLLELRPAHLLLIGGVREDAADAFEHFCAQAPKAAERIHVVPYERKPARLSRLLALCDVVVAPSLFEGTPNALLEAMACGRCILATAVGGHLDLIDHGRTGALLPLEALGRLPEALEELLDLPEAERLAMGRAAREHVSQTHRPEDESAAWARVYAEARASTS